VLQVQKGLKASRASKVIQERLELLVQQDLKDHRAKQAHKVFRVFKVRQEPQVTLAQQDRQDQAVLLQLLPRLLMTLEHRQ
jgi:hypothetical protein